MNRSLIILIALALAGGCSHGPTDHPYHIKHQYSVADPQFRRTIGNLLFPETDPRPGP